MFYDILFPNETSAKAGRKKLQPECFRDLKLDTIYKNVYGDNEYLRRFFDTFSDDAEVIEYRREAMNEFADSDIRGVFKTFIIRQKEILKYSKAASDRLRGAEDSDGLRLVQGRLLDASEQYCASVDSIVNILSRYRFKSRPLQLFVQYMSEYVHSEFYMAFKRRTEALRNAMNNIEYCLIIKEGVIKIRQYDGQEDFGALVASLFGKFRMSSSEEAPDYKLPQLPEEPKDEKIEEEILAAVAVTYREQFDLLDRYCVDFIDFEDETLVKTVFESEFYIMFWDYCDTLKNSGCFFCVPERSNGVTEINGLFDITLAEARKNGGTVVLNDYTLEHGERFSVITGPNQDGKTTYVRAVGQSFYLSGLGLAVPGIKAVIPDTDGIYTHFERDEVRFAHNGKLRDDLIRLKEVIDNAKQNSLVIVNEIFSSTTLDDALILSKEMMNMLEKKGCVVLCVTFLDELSEFNDKTVSLVSHVNEENPEERTFIVKRAKANGLAFAEHLAKRHGLTFDCLKSRIEANTQRKEENQ